MNMANSKINKNFQTEIPIEIRREFKVDENSIMEWEKTDTGKLEISFRKKVTTEDVIGMIKEDGDWDIDKNVYFNE